jgi:hypothetical protein
MRSEKEFALMPYLPYTVVPFYPLFAERGGERVERPKADWEVRIFFTRCRLNNGLLIPQNSEFCEDKN